MKSPFVLLAQLLACTGGITGRKKLQKMVHILQSQGVGFGFDFRLALYGAYSSDLRCQVEELVAYQLVGESPRSADGQPTSHFTAEEKLLTALKSLEESPNPEWAGLARRLNDKTSRDLEGVSTVIYLEKAGLEGHALKTQFQAIKPHLSHEFEAAVAFVTSLNAL